MASDAYRPTTDDVAAVLNAYTRGEYDGVGPGTFTADTTPTATQVEALIAHTLPLVAARLGETIPEALLPVAKSVATLRAAMAVVRSLLRQSDGNEKDLYDTLRQEYLDAAVDFKDAAQGDSASDPGAGKGIGNIGVRTVYTDTATTA